MEKGAKTGIEIAKSAIILGAASSAAPAAAGGISRIAAALPMVGSLGGAKMTLSAVKKLTEGL